MNCDLILTENSCRFCLGDAQDGNAIFCDRKSYLCVEKRLVEVGEIFKFVNLKIRDRNELPDVPSRVCLDCKKSIVAFYSLKKNYQENEAILLGKLEETATIEKADDPVKVELLPVIEEYLKEHFNECLQVTKYSDKLILCQQKNEKFVFVFISDY